jgi:hypothetical protein
MNNNKLPTILLFSDNYMERLPRIVIAGQPQHIIVHGNNRSEVFCCEGSHEHLSAYKALYSLVISEMRTNEIRDATNKSWALGNSRFKEGIQSKLARRLEPAARGGDRKSAQFKIKQARS